MALRNPGTSYLGQSNYTNTPNAPQSIVGTTAIRQNGNIFQASINGGRYQTFARTEGGIFNVLDYSADPTGTTDSTVAIQAAINAALTYGGGLVVNGANTRIARGGAVYLPQGLYKISGTLWVRGTIGFHLFGDGVTNTRVEWAGQAALPRWLGNHPYSGNVTVQSHGLSYSLTGNGTSSAVTVLNSSSVVGTPVTDGSCTWICNGYDLKSDMVRFQETISSMVEGMEFTSAIAGMVGDPTKTPRAVLCSYQDQNGRLASGTGFCIKDCNIDWSISNTGSNNQHDFGVLWDYCSADASNVNNSEGFLHHVQMNGASIAGIQINGSQSQDHFFQQLNIPNSNTCSLMTGDGGSFAVKDSNINCTPGTGTVVVLGSVNDRIVIDHCITEDAGRMLVENTALGSSAWPITIRNCRWSANNMAAGDGQFIKLTSRGPFVFENNIIDGGTGTAGAKVVPVISMPTSGSFWRARITDNAFIYHDPSGSTWTAADASIANGAALGVVETGNMYVDSVRGDTFMRTEAGNLSVFSAATATAWSGGSSYTKGNLVTNGGKTFRCEKTGIAAGSGGPTLTTSSASRPETDNTTSWSYFASVTDGTKRAYVYEIPMPFNIYNLYTFITARTGSSAASVTLTGYTKTASGFEVTLSAAVTTSDSLSFDWAVLWP